MKKRVLIIQPSGIGDLIQIYPLIEILGLNENYQVDILIKNPQLDTIFKETNFFENIIQFNEIKTIQLFKPSIIKKWKKLKGNYDITISLFPGRGLYSALLKKLIGAKIRVGHKYRFKIFKNISTFLTTSINLERKHLLEINYDIFKAAGLLDDISLRDIKRDISWKIPEQYKNLGANFLKNKIGFNNLIGFYPGGNAEFKRWDYSKWNEFILKSAKKYPNKKFLLFFGPDEKSIFHLFDIYNDINNIFIVNNQSFETVLGIMSFLDFFVGNDGGLTHTFSLFNRPQITIFGATDHEYASPMNSKNVNILPKNKDFKPIWIPYDGFIFPEIDNMINEIAVEDILNATEILIKG